MFARPNAAANEADAAAGRSGGVSPTPATRRGRLAVWIEHVLVAAAVIAAFLLRVVPQWRHVFDAGGVWFLENDPWYHVRVADVWIANFPHRLLFDPYLHHPEGEGVGVPVAPFFDLLLALPPALLGLSERAAHVWMAFVPPLLGAAGVLLVWAIARTLFDSRAAVLAAGLLAIEPGGYLLRTLLGFADHHALESALALGVLCALGAAARAEGGRRVVLSVAAGVALGCYLLGWGGGALLVAVLAAWTAAQTLLEGPTAWGRGIAPVLVPCLLVAGALLALGLGRTPRWEIQALALAGTAAGTLALDGARAIASRRRLRPVSFACVALFGAAAIAVLAWLALSAALPEVAGGLRIQVGRFVPSGAALTVSEVRPLFLLGDEVSWLPAWLHLRSTFFLGLCGIGWGAVRWWRGRDRAFGLALVFAAAMLVATLGQVRFGYYLAPALALFSAPVCTGILDLSESAAGADAPRSRALYRAAAAVVVVLLAFTPGAASSLVEASTNRTPPESWRRAMEWLRRETPEPFGEPTAFESAWREPIGSPGGPPRSAYGVLSWWDYGYWIIELGRRPPISNPTQHGAADAARVLLETDPERARAALDRLGARYIVTSEDFAITPRGPRAVSTGLFDAMCEWAGIESSTFYERALLPDSRGALREGLLFRPAYYRTLVARLAVLGSEQTIPRERVLVAELRRPPDGGPAVVVAARWYDGWREGEEALRRGTARGELFGTSPLRSPVPLPAMGGVERVASFGRVQIHERRGPGIAAASLLTTRAR